MTKALQFADAADTVLQLAEEAGDVADEYVTLCVHAGIAAADVVCAARLGHYAAGENHREAVTLLATVDTAASRHLDALLGMKTLAGYSHTPVSRDRATRAGRATEAPLEAARRVQ